MENSNRNIHTEFFDHFHYDKKEDYYWNIVSVSKDDENKRSVYCGINKEDKNDYIYVKQIKISFENNQNFFNNQILKEIYFLVLLRKQKYIVHLDDILLDEYENCKRLFLIFKGNSVSINKLISYRGNDYLSNKDLIKWIIYQIAFGLYILHSNNIIHNDIKPSNLLIDQKGGVTICDFGSATYKEEDSFSYTRYYAPPEFLDDVNLKRDEKSDMWALGVILVELHLKHNCYFKDINNEDKSNENQLRNILKKSGINENVDKNIIKELIYKENSKKVLFTKEEVEKINDQDALDLIQHLLCLNPKERYTAEEVIKSKYLDLPMIKGIDSFDINKIKEEKIYSKLLELIDKNTFLEIILELISILNQSK